MWAGKGACRMGQQRVGQGWTRGLYPPNSPGAHPQPYRWRNSTQPEQPAGLAAAGARRAPPASSDPPCRGQMSWLWFQGGTGEKGRASRRDRLSVGRTAQVSAVGRFRRPKDFSAQPVMQAPSFPASPFWPGFNCAGVKPPCMSFLFNALPLWPAGGGVGEGRHGVRHFWQGHVSIPRRSTH